MLVEPLVYKSESGRMYVVPIGFIHDYASIPRILWPILSPTGPYSRSAVLHDYTDDDKLFKEAMNSEENMPRWLACIMYFAVTGEEIEPQEVWVTGIND